MRAYSGEACGGGSRGRGGDVGCGREIVREDGGEVKGKPYGENNPYQQITGRVFIL
jgi:hypothetical protein